MANCTLVFIFKDFIQKFSQILSIFTGLIATVVKRMFRTPRGLRTNYHRTHFHRTNFVK